MDKDKNKKHQKDEYEDLVIAPMNGDELPKYRRAAYLNRGKRPSKAERLEHKNKYSKKEQRAIIWAGFLSMLPKFLCVLVGFVLTALIIWAWLS